MMFLQSNRISTAKRAFVTRRVETADLKLLAPEPNHAPEAGDLVLARVDFIANHTNLELVTGRKSKMYPGDEIIIAYGNRYAPDQFEAEVPPNLAPCHLVAAGGIASEALGWSSRIVKGPTEITPIGLFVSPDGRPVNLRNYALSTSPCAHRPPVYAVVGGSMNAGKTTTALSLIRGLRAQGLTVAAGKLTGTGSGGDLWQMQDAGAETVLDFTDAGLATTYLAGHDAIEAAARKLIAALEGTGAPAIVVEIADGILQPETRALISSAFLKQRVSGYVYAAESATSAAFGVDWLARQAPVIGISGLMTRSPLAMRETKFATGIAPWTSEGLADGEILLPWIEEQQAIGDLA